MQAQFCGRSFHSWIPPNQVCLIIFSQSHIWVLLWAKDEFFAFICSKVYIWPCDSTINFPSFGSSLKNCTLGTRFLQNLWEFCIPGIAQVTAHSEFHWTRWDDQCVVVEHSCICKTVILDYYRLFQQWLERCCNIGNSPFEIVCQWVGIIFIECVCWCNSPSMWI